MKTRYLLVLVAAVSVAAPVLIVACNGDNSQADGGPQNFDSGNKDVQAQDTGTNDAQQNDGGSDGAACLTFDNTLVPGYPNNIPQP